VAVCLDGLSDAELALLIERRAQLWEAFAGLCQRDAKFVAAVSQGTGDVSKVKLRFGAVEDLVKGVLSCSVACD
jgi:hypothetical protein